jgi:hypothetical protein
MCPKVKGSSQLRLRRFGTLVLNRREGKLLHLFLSFDEVTPVDPWESIQCDRLV